MLHRGKIPELFKISSCYRWCSSYCLVRRIWRSLMKCSISSNSLTTLMASVCSPNGAIDLSQIKGRTQLHCFKDESAKMNSQRKPDGIFANARDEWAHTLLGVDHPGERMTLLSGKNLVFSWKIERQEVICPLSISKYLAWMAFIQASYRPPSAMRADHMAKGESRSAEDKNHHHRIGI